MNPTGVSWQHQLLLKLLNNYSQFLSLSYRKSETTHLRTRTFHRRHLEQRCFKRFARNMSCILTEELNTSYLTCFKGFTWVRQRMVKKILQRCDPTPHFTVEKTGQEAPWIPGRALRTDDCFTVTLMKWLCLFRKPSSLPSISVTSFSPKQNKHSWELRVPRCLG